MTPDPRPARRIVDPDAGTTKVRDEGRCRACGVLGRPTKEGGILNRAHLVSRGQGGDDVDANLIPLCGSGTTGCHAAFDGQALHATSPSFLTGSSAATIRRAVVNSLLPSESEYAISKKGDWWLERMAS